MKLKGDLRCLARMSANFHEFFFRLPSIREFFLKSCLFQILECWLWISTFCWTQFYYFSSPEPLMPCQSSGIWATKSLPSSGIFGYLWWEHSLVVPFLSNSLDSLSFYWLESIPLLNYGISWETYPNLLLIPSSIFSLELFAWLLYQLCFTSPFSTFISAFCTNRK